jgi:hypothetical protein
VSARVRLHARVQGELDLLVVQRILAPEQAARLKERYPTGPWDLVSLARWLGILGAVTAGAGVILLAAELEIRRTLLELALAVLTALLLVLGRWLARARGLARTGAAVELTASLSLQALTIALALHYASGSDDWPALVGVQTALAATLAYTLANRLILIHALVLLFTFFGAETGYLSGWGAYWLGMTYPLRFLLAGAAALGVAFAHTRAARAALRGFARVYLHFGLVVIHLALWFLAVFGFFEDQIRWDGTEGQRIAFSAAWAAVCAGSVWLAGRTGLATLRAYGLVFLVIDAYTFYGQFVAASSVDLWFVHLLLIGGTLVVLALRAERWRRAGRAP